MRRWLLPLAVIVVLLGLWELAARWDLEWRGNAGAEQGTHCDASFLPRRKPIGGRQHFSGRTRAGLRRRPRAR